MHTVMHENVCGLPQGYLCIPTFVVTKVFEEVLGVDS